MPPLSRASAFSRREVMTVSLLVVLQAVVVLLRIDAPFSEPAAYGRSCVNATIARNFFEHGMRLLYPQLDYGVPPGYAALEFPLIPYLAAIVYRVAGVHEWVGRGIPALFGLGTTLVVWMIAREDAKTDLARMAAVVVLVLSPTFIFFSRVFQSDSAMVFFVALTLLLLLQSQRTRSAAGFAAACLACVVAMLLKPSSLVLMPAMASVLVCRGSRKPLRVVILAAATLLPVAAYYLFARTINTYPETVGLDAVVARATFARMLQFSYNLQIAKDIVQAVTPVGVIALAIGLCLALGSRQTWYLPLWAIGATILDLVFNEALSHHEYYQIIWVPLAALCASQAVDAVVHSKTLPSMARAAVMATAVVLLAGSAWLSWRFLALRLQFPPEAAMRLTVASFVESHTPADALVGVEDVDLLFYAHRRGWPIGNETAEPISRARLTSARQNGVEYFAVGDDTRLSGEARAYLDQDGTLVARADRQAIWRMNGE